MFDVMVKNFSSVLMAIPQYQMSQQNDGTGRVVLEQVDQLLVNQKAQ